MDFTIYLQFGCRACSKFIKFSMAYHLLKANLHSHPSLALLLCAHLRLDLSWNITSGLGRSKVVSKSQRNGKSYIPGVVPHLTSGKTRAGPPSKNSIEKVQTQIRLDIEPQMCYSHGPAVFQRHSYWQAKESRNSCLPTPASCPQPQLTRLHCHFNSEAVSIASES